MIRSRFIPALISLAAVLAGPAHSATSGWQNTEGARLRLVVEDRPDADGTLRGALEIRLEPGWKTYWREPGDAGVPPQLSLDGSSNIDDVTMHFPAPQRFTDAWSTWAGYGSSMAIALRFHPADPGKPTKLKSTAFLGVCEDICIPVQMSFTLETNPEHAAGEPAVAAAFAALPGAPHDGFRLSDARMTDEALVFEAAVPGEGGQAELFLATAGGWTLDVPERISAGNGVAVFRAAVLSAPAGAASPVVEYTLVHDNEAVNGQIQAQ